MICPNCTKEIKESVIICPFCDRNIKQEVIQNWKAQIETVVSGYEEHKGLVHGLQKDAIQNGWGHRLYKKGKDWAFEFNLLKGPDNKPYLTMTDMEGYGLTGRNMITQEIPDDLPENERLARFEHMYFSGESLQAAGLFGRGKLLFTAASKDYHIIYDSLTYDGIYRINERKLEGRRLINFAKAYEGKAAYDMLSKLTKSYLKPLNRSGTRIIVVNPKDEIINAIQDGSFLKYIEETWWQILMKYSKNGAKITVKTEEGTNTAKIPQEFKDLSKIPQEKSISKIYPLSFDYNGFTLKIKRVHFIVSHSPVPAEIRGVCLYRREMKVADLGVREIPEKIADRFYGYAEIETNSEFEKIYLEEGIEGPDHYSINKNRGLIRRLRKEVQLLFDKFKTELGFGVKSEKITREKMRRAMDSALTLLNKKMGELGISVGKTTRTRDITINVENILFPKESNVVNIGDRIERIKLKIKNKSDWEHKVRILVFTKGLHDKIIESFFDEGITLKKKDFKTVGPFSFKISLDSYPSEGVIHLTCIVKDALTNKTLANKIIPIFIGTFPPDRIDPIVEIVLSTANFPRGAGNKRINYGEAINNITFTITNKTAEKIPIKFKARVLNARVMSEEIEKLKEKDLCLEPFGEQEIKCPNIEVSKEKYNILDREKGPVVLRSTIIATTPSQRVTTTISELELKLNRTANPLERKNIKESMHSFDNGDKLAKYDIKFWVNMDSGKGVFEDCREWSGGPKEPRSRIQPEGESLICLINSAYPVYENLKENGDGMEIESYVYEQLLRQTLIVLLRKDKLEYWPELEGKGYKDNLEDPDAETYEKIEALLSTLDCLYADYLK